MGLAISEEQRELLAGYYRLLVEWNARMNLTTIVEPQEAAVKHMLDSLVLTKLGEEFFSGPAVDVGTGAGFPGIPLKIARPTMPMALVDSLAKRVGFLQVVVDELGLTGVDLWHRRAEEMGRDTMHREGYHLVVARAVAQLSVLLEYCLPLCRLGGWFVAYKGPQVREELEDAEVAAKELGGKLAALKEYDLPQEMGSRTLVIFQKVTPTPGKYPRRAGIPARKPLGK
ncbi:MAG: 16S rRNA (guanine(527)-N(7))-methyltransferase RsmG [Firmicutes bacterium]|nr:16S rRNA (guanine(527)-N(7))-methyltransferase RsmG [Bacillota bacterium]